MRHELIFDLSGRIGHAHAQVNQVIKVLCQSLVVREGSQLNMQNMANDLFEYMSAVMESSPEGDSK